MKIVILTLFPDMINAFVNESILGRAQENNLITIECLNIRDFSNNKHHKVDDYPYGGGTGMVMTAQPIYDCYKHALTLFEDRPYTIFMSPQGRTFNQQAAFELKDKKNLIIICGHYEGVDERVIEEIVDEEISIGDYVLTGGEIAAVAISDAICRLVPGVLANEDAYTMESHINNLLEFPQYTRPEEFNGRRVPDVLLSGHHKNIENWRLEQQILRTKQKRPDMYEQYLKNKE